MHKKQGMLSVMVFIGLFFVGMCVNVFGAELPKHTTDLRSLDGEIMEIESLHEPVGAAIYMVKDFSTGQMIKLYADPYETLVKVGSDTQAVSDVVLGSKAKILYRESKEKGGLPRMTFVKIRGSY